MYKSTTVVVVAAVVLDPQEDFPAEVHNLKLLYNIIWKMYLCQKNK